jgi:hypothetical protein
MLRDALMEQPGVAEDVHAQARMKQMHEFIERMTDWLDDVQKMDSATLASLMSMGAKVQKLLEMKDWVKQVFSPTPEPQLPLAAPSPLPLPESVTPTTEVNHGKL